MSAPIAGQAAAHRETLEAIKFDAKACTLKLLDQRLLPHKVVFDDIRTVEEVHAAIKEMRVRGAPAIAVTAVLGIAVAANVKSATFASKDAVLTFLRESLDYVGTSRPTAVNLFNAIREFKAWIASNAAVTAATSAAEVINAFAGAAKDYFDADVAINEGIMAAGCKYILGRLPANDSSRKVSVMTICNTGALATARYGTALGVVRELFYQGRLERVYALETRPWNQGARLTVFECVTEHIPVTLIVDGAASALLRSRTIDAIIVGADRVCANGDTANKIGTYQLAVAAQYHHVPFYVAAPSTTLDPHTPNGDAVHVEEREPTEITNAVLAGSPGSVPPRVVCDGPTLSIWNPVFDVTPAALITGGIITERGVFAPAPHAAGGPLFNIQSMLQAS